MLKQIILFICLLPFAANAKDYRLQLHVSNLPEDASPILLRIYNGNMFVLDSLPVRGEGGDIAFTIPEGTAPGALRCVLGMPTFSMFGGQPVTLDLLFNNEDIDIALDYNNPFQSAQIIASEENRIFFDFKKADALFHQKLGLLEQVVVNYPDRDEFYLKAAEYFKKFQLQRDKMIDKTAAAHRKTLAGRIIRNQKIPATDATMTPQERDSIFRNEFLAKIDFSDTTLLATSLYTDRAYQYIQMHMRQDASPRENEANCIRALDILVPHLDVNPTVQQHILQFLLTGFEAMKMEEVLAHISANYSQQCGGTGDIVKHRLEAYQRMAVGQEVKDFTLTDINGEPVNLYNTVSPYTLLLFWHTECNHCQALMKILPVLAQKNVFRNHQIKIIGISIDDDRAKWEEFSRTYALDWINTYSENGFHSELAGDYNLFATPSMFLLDENHRIIAKPTTPQELEKNINELK